MLGKGEMRPGIPIVRSASDLFYFMAMQRIGMRMKPGDDPVCAVEVPWSTGECAASCGVAVIRGKGVPDLAVGRESSLALFETVAEGRPDLRRSRADCRRLADDYEMLSDRLRRSMDDQIELLKIQHKICELCPGFRIWPSDKDFTPGGQEVQLRDHADGFELLGIVWGWEIY